MSQIIISEAIDRSLSEEICYTDHLTGNGGSTAGITNRSAELLQREYIRLKR